MHSIIPGVGVANLLQKIGQWWYILWSKRNSVSCYQIEWLELLANLIEVTDEWEIQWAAIKLSDWSCLRIWSRSLMNDGYECWHGYKMSRLDNPWRFNGFLWSTLLDEIDDIICQFAFNTCQLVYVDVTATRSWTGLFFPQFSVKVVISRSTLGCSTSLRHPYVTLL